MNTALQVLQSDSLSPFELASRTRALRNATSWANRSVRLLPDECRAELLAAAVQAAIWDNGARGRVRFVAAKLIGRYQAAIRHRAALRRLISSIVDETRAVDRSFRELYDKAQKNQLERAGADATQIARRTA